MPFRIEVKATCAHSIELLRSNAIANANVERTKHRYPHTRKLAVVGGGPMLIHDLDELRAWDGDIWAINHTADWLADQGIEATLFCMEPGKPNWKTRRRILASLCDPAMVTDQTCMFDTCEVSPTGLPGGCSAATRAPLLALSMGYTDVSFFGCEGSFEGADHVDRDERPTRLFVIRAGGRDYMVEPQMLIQCQELTQLFNTFGQAFKNRSHGLLEAMQAHTDTWEVVAVSGELKEHLEAVNGHNGLYEGNYVPAGMGA